MTSDTTVFSALETTIDYLPIMTFVVWLIIYWIFAWKLLESWPYGGGWLQKAMPVFLAITVLPTVPFLFAYANIANWWEAGKKE